MEARNVTQEHAQEFWKEEIRGFPHGGEGAAVWVVRRDGNHQGAPLRVLFAWETGAARDEGMASRPPLGVIHRVLEGGREELIRRDKKTALWAEPILEDGRPRGCLVIWFRAADPWRENIFLWGQRLAARVGPVLRGLRPGAADRKSVV